MTRRVEQNAYNIERGAEALLREHPDALVCGMASDGLIVPVPQSVGLWGQGAIEGRAVTDVVLAEDRMTVVEAWRRVQQDGVAEGRVRLLSKPSSWVTLHLVDLRAHHGVFLCILLPAAESAVDEPDAATDALAALPSPRFSVILEDETARVIGIDDAFTLMFGYGAEDVMGKSIIDQIHPDDRAPTVERWIAMLSTRRAQQLRVRRRHKDGHYVWLDMTLRNFLNQPDRNHVVVEMTDVSAEMATVEALQEKSELLRCLLERTSDGLLQIDNKRAVVYHNPRWLEIVRAGAHPSCDADEHATAGAQANATTTEPHRDLLRRFLGAVSEDSVVALEAELDRVLGEGVDRELDVDVALPSGGWRRVCMNIQGLRPTGEAVTGALVTARDPTGSGRSSREADGGSLTDSLTGCQSRSAILSAVQHELDSDGAASTGVVYVQVGSLDPITDTYGSAAGDELLVLVAERLRAASREHDKVGRLGPNEFLVLLCELTTPEVAMNVARRIEASLQAVIELASGPVVVGARVGVAHTMGEPIGPAKLLKRAKAAASASKRQGRRDDPSPSQSRVAGRRHVRIARWAWRGRARRTNGGAVSHVDVAARAPLSEEEMERRLTRHTRQHDAVAHLGQLALRGHEQAPLLQAVVETVARTLELELCAVLRLRESAQVLDIIASVGYSHGPNALPAGASSQAGYALDTRAPVVSHDLRREERFDARLLVEQGMVSGMSAVIEGRERPFGVLSAHTSRRREFGRDDVNFLVAIANVISAAVERERKEDSAKHAALHDPLTGLPNRTLALDRIDRALARRRRDGTEVAVLLLDVDRLKVINDSLGHEAGDAVLLALATRLQKALGADDTIARLNGDEFLIISEAPDGARSAVALAERLGDAVRRPLPLQSGEHHPSASIGIAVVGTSEDTSASLLRDADAAMHRAKEAGRGRYELFDETVRAHVVSRLRTETELRHALEREQLEVHYQPIIDVVSGAPVAAEALVRWRHPRHGLIPPLEFIPIAEETGLIGALGRRVLERAAAQGAAWQRRYGTPLRMYVNVSGSQLADVEFPAQAVEIARRSGLMPETLGLEVTESVLIAEGKSSLDILSELDAHGLPLVLDDFGTGYSSLSYLRRFPLSAVKVDRSFIDGLGSNPQDAAIMRAIVEMCRALGFAVVGEGVETEAQLLQLRELGCDHVQGYLFCHPMPVEEASAFLDRRYDLESLGRAA